VYLIKSFGFDNWSELIDYFDYSSTFEFWGIITVFCESIIYAFTTELLPNSGTPFLADLVTKGWDNFCLGYKTDLILESGGGIISCLSTFVTFIYWCSSWGSLTICWKTLVSFISFYAQSFTSSWILSVFGCVPFLNSTLIGFNEVVWTGVSECLEETLNVLWIPVGILRAGFLYIA